MQEPRTRVVCLFLLACLAHWFVFMREFKEPGTIAGFATRIPSFRIICVISCSLFMDMPGKAEPSGFASPVGIFSSSVSCGDDEDAAFADCARSAANSATYPHPAASPPVWPVREAAGTVSWKGTPPCVV